MKLLVHAIPHQSALWAASFPPGEAKGILRIRPTLNKTISAYRKTPQSGPLGLPAPLSGALWTRSLAAPFGGGAPRSGKGGGVGWLRAVHVTT